MGAGLKPLNLTCRFWNFLGASSRSCRRRTQLVQRANAPPWSSYLRRPSSPVRQHASSRPNDTLALSHITLYFSIARSARQVDQGGLAKDSQTVNLLSRSSVGSPIGTMWSRHAPPTCSLEGWHRRRTRSAMSGCFPSLVVQSSRRGEECACRPRRAARASTTRIGWIACA